LREVGKGGGAFDFRLNFRPSARRAFREGEGPRAFAFSIVLLATSFTLATGTVNLIG
jgi:hypothetical protein